MVAGIQPARSAKLAETAHLLRAKLSPHWNNRDSSSKHSITHAAQKIQACLLSVDFSDISRLDRSGEKRSHNSEIRTFSLK